MRAGPEVLHKTVAFLGAQLGAIDGCRTGEREDGFDDQLFDMVHDIGQSLFVTAPPGRNRGQAQVLTQQHLGDPGQVGHQAGVFEHAAAQRIGNHDRAVSDCLEQAGGG